MLLSLTLNPAEKILNQYLKLDPEIPAKLASLHNKTVQIELRDLPLNFYIQINSDRVQLIDTCYVPVDTVIQGTSLALLAMRFSKTQNINEILADYDVSITGDIEIAQQLKEIFSSVDIDWEEYLAKIIGDPLAHLMGYKFRGFKNWSHKTKDSLLRDVTEYVQEEASLFPPRSACSDFFNDVDDLRDAVECLAQKIQQLQNDFSEQTT